MNLRIAIVGYGRMGRAVESEALARGHSISTRIDKDNIAEASAIGPDNSDCIIEFTNPEQALPNFRTLLATGVPLVTGTTGWADRMEEVRGMVRSANGSFLYSSNFSPGVNILFKLNQVLAKMMDPYPEFDCFIEESHHRHKKDAPSGTALSLAEQVISGLERKDSVTGAEVRNRPPETKELSVSYTRAGEIIGKHSVSYISDIEQVTIRHEAFNRRGFALGAVLAAEWLPDKKGFYNFTDIFETPD